MLYCIIKQINTDIYLVDNLILDAIKTIFKQLEFSVKTFGANFEYEIDEAMYEDLERIINSW